MKRKSLSLLATIMAILIAFSTLLTSVTLGATPVAPVAPTAVKAVGASTSSVTVSWAKVTGVTGYAVFMAASSTAAYTAVGTTTAVSLTKTGLAASTTYYFKVRSYKTVGAKRTYSKDSAIVSAKTLTPVPVAADYKGVVFYVQNTVLQLAPEGFTVNIGTPDEASAKDGSGNRHYIYLWQENKPEYMTDQKQVATFTADMKVAPRYFRVNLSKAEKIGKTANANFKEAIKRGDSPGFVFGPTSVGPTSLPLDTKKVYFDSWIQDYTLSSKYKKTDYVNQAALYVAQLDKLYQSIVKARPSAKLYVSSLGLVDEAFPRIDTRPTDRMMDNYGDVFLGLMDFKAGFGMNIPMRKEINKQLKALSTAKGYILIDLEKMGMTNADGYYLDKYAHPNGVGVTYNQEGLTIFGDYVCTAMGLKTAKVMYGPK